MTAERSQAGGADPPLPAGFRIELDPDTRQLTEAILFGGSPARAMKLSAAGCRALGELRAGPVRSAAAGVLARRLTDAGLAHPRPPAAPAPAAADVTVLIPVRDRTRMLDQCLTALGPAYPVIVVDDGSADPDGVAAVVARHHATLVRRQASGGPGVARNDGLADTGSELVAFLDSDCAPPPGWIDRLAAHLADPLVGAVAPRVVGAPGGACPQTAAGRYEEACGSLDLGPREARVVPGSRVAYVPTAALLVRRAALEAAASRRPVFDAALRYGEDVDLIWRMHDSGWRIRYEPAVRVAHRGPQSWADLLARRFRYGTSGAPLARRHPGRLAPLVLQPWPALTVAAILARRPVAAAGAAAAGWLTLRNTVRSAGPARRRRGGRDGDRGPADGARHRPVRDAVRRARARRRRDGPRARRAGSGAIAAARTGHRCLPAAQAGPGPGPVRAGAHRRRYRLWHGRLGWLRPRADTGPGDSPHRLAAAARDEPWQPRKERPRWPAPGLSR